MLVMIKAILYERTVALCTGIDSSTACTVAASMVHSKLDYILYYKLL